MAQTTATMPPVPPPMAVRRAVASARNAAEDDSSLSCVALAALDVAEPLTDSDAPRTLSGTYSVTSQVKLSGELTIEPGTTFIVLDDSSIQIGWLSNRTTLTAQGTPDAPIRFCSDKPVLGRWRGLRTI